MKTYLNVWNRELRSGGEDDEMSPGERERRGC